MPVFPDVESIIILLRLSFPDFSASSMIRKAGRSFTDPPGLNHSALAYISTRLFFNPSVILSIFNRGVFPTLSKIVLQEICFDVCFLFFVAALVTSIPFFHQINNCVSAPSAISNIVVNPSISSTLDLTRDSSNSISFTAVVHA